MSFAHNLTSLPSLVRVRSRVTNGNASGHVFDAFPVPIWDRDPSMPFTGLVYYYDEKSVTVSDIGGATSAVACLDNGNTVS